jgi:hypothetical protein
MNYEKDIQINDQALDIEWLEQPSKMMRYTRHSTDMNRALDQAKQDLDIANAEVDHKIRKNPDKFLVEGKITVDSVKAAILVHPDYQKAYTKFLEAKYEYDMAQGAVRAFEQRKSALENLVKLYQSNYFAGPSIPRDLKWEREEKQKMMDDRIAKRLTRK